MKQINKLIEKYNLSEAVKRLNQINEYTFYSSSMTEDDQDPNAMGGDPNAMGEDPNAMGGGPNTMGEDPNTMGGDPNTMGGDPNSMGGDPNDIGGDTNAMVGDPNAMGGDPNGDMPPIGGDEDVEDLDMDVEEDGDEVIDVDELTQSQETTEFKVDNVDDKLTKVLKIISKFTDAIEANDKKIEDLKAEFEKRNPTAEETLNLRSLASYPFSERPNEYWKKQQEEHPNYNVISNNDVSTADEQEEFKIKKSDIDNFNENDILKTLGENHMKLSDYIDF